MTFAAWLPVFDDSEFRDWRRGERVREGLFERPVMRAFLRGGGMVLDVAEAVAAGTAGLGEFSEGKKLSVASSSLLLFSNFRQGASIIA